MTFAVTLKLSSNKFKIGIKCSGNPYFSQDEYRKIPVELMLSYMPQDAEIYYIDKEVGHEGCIDLGEKIETWEDTLDFISPEVDEFLLLVEDSEDTLLGGVSDKFCAISSPGNCLDNCAII